MIELRDVCKSYPCRGGRQAVLWDLCAEFDGSADLGILGGNGSGKSTLLRMIAGMDRPDSGQVIRHARVSYPVSYSGGFHPNLSARENVRFIARLYGADTAAVVRFVREFSEIGAHFDRPISTFSNSMKARVTFAMSMAIPFEIYLVDEVTAVGDVGFKRKCMEALAERRRNARIIMVSQAVTTITKICQRGAILDGGQLQMFDTMAEAVSAYEDNLAVLHV